MKSKKVKTTTFRILPTTLNKDFIDVKLDCYLNLESYMFFVKTPEIFKNLKDVPDIIEGEILTDVYDEIQKLHSQLREEFNQIILNPVEKKEIGVMWKFVENKNGKQELLFHYFVVDIKNVREYYWFQYPRSHRTSEGVNNVPYVLSQTIAFIGQGGYEKFKLKNSDFYSISEHIFKYAYTKQGYKFIMWTQEKEDFLSKMKVMLENLDQNMVHFFTKIISDGLTNNIIENKTNTNEIKEIQ